MGFLHQDVNWFDKVEMMLKSSALVMRIGRCLKGIPFCTQISRVFSLFCMHKRKMRYVILSDDFEHTIVTKVIGHL